MSLPTFPRAEVERVAGVVASILKSRVEGAAFTDPFDPHTWESAGRGICQVVTLYEWPGGEDFGDSGSCAHEPEVDDAPSTFIRVMAVSARPAFLSRVLVHELSHAVLCHFASSVFTEDLWTQFDHCYQARENICRCVERLILGDFGRGWLPEHGFYWN